MSERPPAPPGDDERWPGLRVWLLSWWITLTRYHWFSEARRRETRRYADAVARMSARPPVTITRPS